MVNNIYYVITYVTIIGIYFLFNFKLSCLLTMKKI